MVQNYYSLSEATVPRVTLITRKLMETYDVMNSKHIGADMNFAACRDCGYGAKGVRVIFKKEISETDDHEAKLAEKEKEYADLFVNPYTAATRFYR
jgi:propionyl-CoA carboxylase beta chain